MQSKESVTGTRDVNSAPNETKTVSPRARMAGKKMNEVKSASR